ncbi:MAG TPA: hypothetical protein VF260_06245 [Bacilli bacterium]
MWFLRKRQTTAQLLRDLQSKLDRLEDHLEHMAPIVVKNMHVEKVIVDKLEYHNNIGALGIKELKGRLNIGANYAGLPPDWLEHAADKASEKPPGIKQKDGKKDTAASNQPEDGGPKLTFSPRPPA